MAKREIDKRVRSYQDKNGNTLYMFQIYLGINPQNGKRMRTTRRSFTTAKAAETALKRLEYQAKQGLLEKNKKKEKKTFKDIYKIWFENYKLTVKESTWATTENNFNSHILPKFGDLYIDKIDVVTCQKIINAWSHDHPKTFKKFKNYASNVMHYALSIELIDSNPFDRLTTPKGEALIKEEKPINFYDKTELLAFLKAANKLDDLRYTFFYLLAFTGLRKGEALALTWKDIDLHANTLRVSKTVTRGYESRLIINTPKTKKGMRTILLDDGMVDVLKKYKSKQILSLDQSIPIFNKDNQVINPTMTRFWLRTIYNANPDLKKITTHEFRHTHASLLFESGATLKDVQERLGHADIQTTSNIYTHVTEDRNQKVVNSFAKFMSS